MASANLLHSKNMDDVTWSLLPQGEQGLPPVGGVRDSVIEEAHILPLATHPGFYMLGRTTQGRLAAATCAQPSGSDWAPTEWVAYYDPLHASELLRPLNQRPGSAFENATHPGLKNPRGPITPKRFSNGR